MLSLAEVLAVADGRTPAEIARLSGLPLPEVERTLKFLAKYSFVEARGSKVRVDRELMSLPSG